MELLNNIYKQTKELERIERGKRYSKKKITKNYIKEEKVNELLKEYKKIKGKIR